MTTNYIANGSGQVHILAADADETWVLNSGFTMLANGSTILADANARIFNYGGIVSLGAGGVQFKDGGGYLLNGTTGSITGFDGVAIDGTGASVSVVNFGMIVGTDLYGIAVGGSRYLDFDNHGYCYGEVNAVVVYGSAFSTITNYGTMESHNGPAVYVDTISTERVALTNYGECGSVEVVLADWFDLENTGTVGDVTVNTSSITGVAFMTNSGTMGAIHVNGGDAYLTNNKSAGGYSGSDDEDTITNTGAMGLVTLSGGNDYYAAYGTATSANIYGGGGNDSLSSLTDVGFPVHFFGEQGNDVYGILNASSLAVFDETGGNGKDTVFSAVDFSLSGPLVVGKIENLTLAFDAVAGTGTS